MQFRGKGRGGGRTEGLRILQNWKYRSDREATEIAVEFDAEVALLAPSRGEGVLTNPE